MNRRSSCTVLLLAALLGVPVAAADPLADITASGLQATGQTDMTGPARAALYRSFADNDKTDFTLNLTARHLHVEVDHAQSVVNAAGAAVEGYLWSDNSDYDDANLALDEGRPHFKVEVLALAGSTFTAEHIGSCLGIDIPTESTVQASKFAHSERPIPSISSQDASQVGLCAGTLALEGDFLLVLWEADVTVASAGGQVSIHTGKGTGQARGPQGATAPTEVPQSDQAYITVTAGRLALQRPIGSDGTLDAFLDHVTAHVAGVVEAMDAQGKIAAAADQPLAVSSLLRMQGDLEIDADRTAADLLRIQVLGQADAVQLDGENLKLLSAGTTRIPVAPKESLAVAAVVGTAAVMAWLLLRRRPAPKLEGPFLFRLAVAQFLQSRFRLALFLANANLRLRPTPDTHALKARILFELRRFGEVVAAASKAEGGLASAEDEGQNSLVASMAAARRPVPDAEEAGRWFARATENDPDLESALQDDAPLRRVSTQQAFRLWLRPSSQDDLLQP